LVLLSTHSSTAIKFQERNTWEQYNVTGKMTCYLNCYRYTSQERCLVIWTVTATRHRKDALLSEVLSQHVTGKMYCYLNCYRNTSQERVLVIWTVTATRQKKDVLLSECYRNTSQERCLLSELLPQHVTGKSSCYLNFYRNTSQKTCLVIWTVTATRLRKDVSLSELLPQHVTEKMSCYLNCYRDIFRHPRRTSLNALFKLFKDMFCKPATSQILW